MSERCPICDQEECHHTPDEKELVRCRAEVEMLKKAIEGWRSVNYSLESKLAVAVRALELIGFRASASIINAEEEWSMSANWVERLCTKALKSINGGE